MPAEPSAPIVDAAEVAAIAREIREAGRFALDLEFVSESRYVPDLGLVQVSWGDVEQPQVATIDPLAVDPRPVVEIVADPGVETLMHAAQADLALLAHTHGVRGAGIVDSQIAAAFLGMGEQIGYAPLIEHTLGVKLDKGSQFSEWLRRPLDSQQVAYALDDVRYLPRAWQALRERLERRGRLHWVLEQSSLLAETWATRTPPEEMYRRVSGWNSLRSAQQGALRALAAWRERESLSANRPPSRLMHDRTLLQIARRPPADVDGLRQVRGMSGGVAQRYGDAILRALRQGQEHPPPPERARKPLAAPAQAWAGMVAGLVQSRAREAGIAARFVAPRDEIKALVRWWSEGDREAEPPLPLLRGWRRELVGGQAIAWLAGESVIAIDPDSPSGIGLDER